MRHSLLISLLAALATAAPIVEKRQGFGGLASILGSLGGLGFGLGDLSKVDINKVDLSKYDLSKIASQFQYLVPGLDLGAALNAAANGNKNATSKASTKVTKRQDLSALLSGIDFSNLDISALASQFGPLLSSIDLSTLDLPALAAQFGPLLSGLGAGAAAPATNSSAAPVVAKRQDLSALLSGIDFSNLDISALASQFGPLLSGIDFSTLDLPALAAQFGPLLSGLGGAPAAPATNSSAAPVVAKRQDLSALMSGIDLSKIDLSKLDIPKLMQQFGPLLQNMDLSKIMGSIDLSKIDLSKLDLSKLGGMGSMGGMAGMAGSISPDVMKSMAKVFTGTLPVQKLYKIEELKPLLRPDAKRVKIINGPYKIKGQGSNEGKVGNSASLDPSGTGYMYSMGDDFPRDITILDVQSGVYDQDFAPIDIGKGLYNHHNVFFDASHSTPVITACGSAAAGGIGLPLSIFMGGAAESTTMPYTSADGKFNSGYYLAKNAKISNMVDVVNYNKDDRDVYTISEMEYVPGQISDALKAMSQVIDIDTCNGSGSGFNVHPPEGVKQWSLNGSDITMTKDGYFLSAKAHMHDGGDYMVATLNGKEICTSRATYGGPGREGTNPDGTPWKGISGTTMCEKVVPVKAGDKLRLVAHFDVAAHPERQFGDHKEEEHGEMGMAEGMALFTAAFALAEPGKDPKYTIVSA